MSDGILHRGTSRSHRARRIVLTSTLVGLVIAGTTPSFAISDEDIYNQLAFNFFNPGGRALGMGGAAVAAVQDSTASLANPGALVNLIRDEFFVEYRANTFDEEDASFTSGLFTAVSGSELADTASPTYVSYVHPWTTTRNGEFRQWVVSFSRQELVDTERSVEGQELQVTDEAGAGRFFTATANGDVDLDVVQYNVGIAGQLTENFSLGLTGTYAEMTLDSVGASETLDPFGIFGNVNPRERVFGTDLLAFSTLVDDESDTAFTGSLGLFWQPNSFYSGDNPPPIKLGLSYNRGPEFEVPITVLDATGVAFAPQGETFVLKVPDRYGVGFAYEMYLGPNAESRLTWTADVVFVAYNELLDGFQSNLNTFTRQGREISGEQVQIEYDIDDGYELRAGFEWTRDIGRSWNFGLRTGFARLPSNVIFADPNGITELGGDGQLNSSLQQGLAALYPEGDDQNAVSLGINFAFVGRGVNSIIEFAYQSADDFDQAVGAYILRF